MQNLDPQRRDERLAELNFSNDLFHLALDLAAEDVRGCTDMDAPSMRGTMFWSRTNRYLAEQLIPLGWERTSRDSILRMIHPERTHVVTAISAAGGVGDLEARVRSKNPKGPKTARMVEMNGQLAVMTRDQVRWGRELDEMPTWCLLYKWNKGVISAELSLPVKMNGAFIDEWLERIPLDLPDLGDPGFDVTLLDDPGDEDGPQVMVEYLGG
ncbi:hypothetical protein QEZ40_001688 [Streptomyces katrae]|uniref:Uncharacterized protein n=1 Tax=Streptomyces katrae TaxID=68223 RepID=A0ABT7GVX0_9ACTN|nr:hypothetical protein [Streptomyces katrae]MDK9497040.1 hypothetical protein [Streptomyces katrae]